MIDIHAHILPGLDDGPKQAEESLDMLRIAQNDGIEVMVATPHFHRGMFECRSETVLEARDGLARRASDEGLGIKLLAGSDD